MRMTAAEATQLAASALAVALATAFFSPAFRDAVDRGGGAPAAVGPAVDGGVVAVVDEPGVETPDAGAAVAPRTGKMVGLFLSIQSEPAGARAIVDGAEVGRTPILTNVACVDGAAVTIEVVGERRMRWRGEATCSAGATVPIQARLAAR